MKKSTNDSCCGSCSSQSNHVPIDKQALKQPASSSNDTILGPEETTGPPLPPVVSSSHQQVVTWSRYPFKQSNSFSKNNDTLAERNAMTKNFALRESEACVAVDEPALPTSPSLPSPQPSPPSTMKKASQPLKMQPIATQCAVEAIQTDLQRCSSSSNSTSCCTRGIVTVRNDEEPLNHETHFENAPYVENIGIQNQSLTHIDAGAMEATEHDTEVAATSAPAMAVGEEVAVVVKDLRASRAAIATSSAEQSSPLADEPQTDVNKPNAPKDKLEDESVLVEATVMPAGLHETPKKKHQVDARYFVQSDSTASQCTHAATKENQVDPPTAVKSAPTCAIQPVASDLEPPSYLQPPEAEMEEETGCNYVASSKGSDGDHKSCRSSVAHIASLFKTDDLAMKSWLQDPPEDKTQAVKMDRKLENAFDLVVAADTTEAEGNEVSRTAGTQRYEIQGLDGSDATPTTLATLLESNTACSAMPWVEAILSVTGQEYGELDASIDGNGCASAETFFDDSLEGHFDPPEGELTPSEDLAREQYEGPSAAPVEPANLFQDVSIDIQTENTMTEAEQTVTTNLRPGTCTKVEEEPRRKAAPDANLVEEPTYETPREPSYELHKEPSLDSKRHPYSVHAEHDLVAILRAELRRTMKMEPRGQAEPEGEIMRPVPTVSARLSAPQLELANACTGSTPAAIHSLVGAVENQRPSGYHPAVYATTNPQASYSGAGMTPAIHCSDTMAIRTSPAERWPQDAADCIQPLPTANGPGILKPSVRCSDQSRRLDFETNIVAVEQKANTLRTDSPPHVRRLNRDNARSPLPLLKQPREPPGKTPPQQLGSLLQPQQKRLEYKPQSLRQPRAPRFATAISSLGSSLAEQVDAVAINKFADTVVSKSSASGTPDREGRDCVETVEPIVGLPPSPRGVMEVVDQAVNGAWDSSKPPCVIHVMPLEAQDHVEDLSIENDHTWTSARSMLDVTFAAVKSMVPAQWGLKFPQSNEYQEHAFEYGETLHASFYRKPHLSFVNPSPPTESETPKGPMADVLDKFFKLASLLPSDATTLCSDLSPSEPK